MWNDNETTEDLLSFKIHAKVLKEIILTPNLRPLVLGVYADWGGGKSSVMHMLEEELKADATFLEHGGLVDSRESRISRCISVNGWLFEGYEDAKIALITAVLQGLKEQTPQLVDLGNRITAFLGNINKLKLIRAAATAFSTPHTAVLAGAKMVGESLPLEAAGTVTTLRTFRTEFEKLLSDAQLEHLIILIDDLDRCSPERIIDTLEAIKLFLNVPGTTIVIGADRRIIEYAVLTKYHKPGLDVEQIG